MESFHASHIYGTIKSGGVDQGGSEIIIWKSFHGELSPPDISF